MNERIKLLAGRAGYYLYDLTETHECKTIETDSLDEWITLEKFVYLILQEAITALDADDGATHHTELLLSHFGLLQGESE